MDGGLCRDHERAPEPRRETNYFFLMSREFDWLRTELERNPERIRPERYRNEALGMLRDAAGLGDLSISRPKSRLDWGIELPFDRDHVCYVWFDALISYLTGAGYPDDPAFPERWASVEHLIGKDILKPHAIFWPIMLRAIGLEPYRQLSVHGYWNVDERKVSKSLGKISPCATASASGLLLPAARWAR
jgi:methionyl-tRNA synthetase